jgi:hypothetical protein
VDEFHDASQRIFGAVVPASAKPRREEVKQGAEPLSARAENIFADLLNERNIGTETLMNTVLHPFHVGFEFFEDVLEGSYHLDILRVLEK